MQRHAARAVVVHLEPALGHDAARAVVQLAHGAGDAFGGQHVALGRLDHGGGLVLGVGQPGDRAVGVLAVVGGGGIQHHVTAGQAGFHLAHLFGLDLEVARDHVDLAVGQHLAVRVALSRLGAEALLHRAQVEKQLALRLGRGDLDHAPVLQDVFVDLGLDPVNGIADQAHTLVRVEALDGLHQAHVAFLDQVAVRQAITQVLAGNRDDQAQVRHHQPSGGFQVVVVAQAARRFLLVLQGEQRHAVDRRDVGVQVAQRGQGERAAGPAASGRQGAGDGSNQGSSHVKPSSDRLKPNISTHR